MKQTEDYLLEIGTEELPVSVLRQWINGSRNEDDPENSLPVIDIATLQKNWLLDAEKISFLASPRRLALYIQGLDKRQRDEKSEIKGPPVSVAFKDDKPTMAAIGFCRSQEVDISDLTKGDDGYVYVFKETTGKSTLEILPQLSKEIFDNFTPKKTMRWGENSLRFTRPIRWLVALFGEEVVRFELDGIKAGRTTLGHRFQSKDPVELARSSDYIESLRANQVLLNVERKESIRKQIESLGSKVDLVPVQKGFDALLDEVTNMVEKPKVAVGSYSEKFLGMPKEVLYTSMRAHQRYFPLESKTGSVAPKFFVVHNGSPEAEDLIVKGNQRVLSARLEDAHFFYYEDASKPFENFAARLEGLVFHSKLGNMLQKAQRLTDVSEDIARYLQIDSGLLVSLKRAAFLAKADLVTQMVVEFPSLQGVMGREYALRSGERQDIADAIHEHYLPKSRHRDAKLPETNFGIIVALADKIDSAVALLLVEKPSASKDPYGIRRYMTGWMRIIVDKNLSIGSYPLVEKIMALLKEQNIPIAADSERVDQICRTLLDELHSYKTIDDVGRGEAAAVIASISERGFGRDNWLGDINLTVISNLIDNLKSLSEEALINIVEPFVRCKNLSNLKIGYRVLDDSMGQPELDLLSRLEEIDGSVTQKIKNREYSEALASLESLRVYIDSFFDKVLIMEKDKKIRHNRITLLNMALRIYEKYADFSKIQLKSH